MNGAVGGFIQSILCSSVMAALAVGMSEEEIADEIHSAYTTRLSSTRAAAEKLDVLGSLLKGDDQ